MTALNLQLKSGTPLSKSRESSSVEIWNQLVMTPGILISKGRSCPTSSEGRVSVYDTSGKMGHSSTV